jgi:hypothetical protein
VIRHGHLVVLAIVALGSSMADAGVVNVRPAAVSTVIHEPQRAQPPVVNPQPEPIEFPASITAPAQPSTSGFFSTMFSEIPQPGTLSETISLVFVGAALCRFGSAFLRIRR